MTTRPPRSSSSWLKLLLFAFCLQALVVVSLSATEDAKKDSLKSKKPILEKKSVLKSGVAKTTLATPVESGLSEPAGNDSLPTFIDEDNWEDPKLWEEPPENGTSTALNGTTVEYGKETLVSNERYFLAHTITNETLAMSHWVDLKSLPKQQQFTHEVLSDSHRRAASINLPFPFPFYGQNVEKATIATGGFMFLGQHVHSWLAATQYIAPLMANFDTRNSTNSNVLYGYNTTHFVVEWRNVRLQEEPKAEFTFQCVLHLNGDIAFVYKNIPIKIQDIPDSGHPVKIGVSDAYFINKAHIYVRRKTIYEYHKLDMLNSTANMISNRTAIFLKALPTCVTFSTCDACVANHTDLQFKCSWCPSAGRCSDGFDRGRQEWISKQCDQEHNVITKSSSAMCPIVTTPSTPSTTEHSVPSSTPSAVSTTAHSIPSTESSDSKHIDLPNDKNLTQLEYNMHDRRISNSIPGKKSQGSSGLALSLFFMLSVVAGLGLWVFYAYRNPTSASGQLLIRWRPSAWRWNSAETRYTAASIHM